LGACDRVGEEAVRSVRLTEVMSGLPWMIDEPT